MHRLHDPSDRTGNHAPQRPWEQRILPQERQFYTLVMMAPAEIGLPYGSLPRLILSWVSTEAVRSSQPAVLLGDSLASFMRELGLSVTGGRRGSILRVKSQLQRLFSTSISCIYNDECQWANTGFRIADETRLWWHPKNPEQLDLWHSRVTLGGRFFRELIEHPVPVDIRALKALRRSPLALDVYCWLTHRMSYLKRETIVPMVCPGGPVRCRLQQGGQLPEGVSRCIAQGADRLLLGKGETDTPGAVA